MKNPFTINFLCLGTIIMLCSVILFSECQCCHNYNDILKSIIIGVLSSALLLLLVELILFIRDNTKYAFLSGKYKRLEIYQINENRKRWASGEPISINGGKQKLNEGEKLKIKEITHEFRNGIYSINGKQFIYKNDSCYHRLAFYDELIDKKKIELEYLFYGKYSGTVEYDEGTTKISITLDNTNEMQGKGTYQYTEKNKGTLPDLGIYEMQVDEKNKSKLYVYYKNTIPSGLAEGYEIWEKI